MLKKELADKVIQGDRKAVSKAITLVENRENGYLDFLAELYPHAGRAFLVGVTGPPGTGKSSLVDQLVREFRLKKMKVAVLAVDPTSPISGGAILGDRVRMLDHSLDQGVFIRSMASRGDEGGLSHAAKNAVRILDAAGNDVVLVETVGIGQAEIEIVKVTDLIVVVLMPELGDEIQAVKAGLMEIGDIFIVNKSDLPGADRVIYNIEPVLSKKRSGWKQLVLKTSASNGEGLDEMVSRILQFKEFTAKLPTAKEGNIEKFKDEIIESVARSISDSIRRQLSESKELLELAERAKSGELAPDIAAQILLKRYTFSKTK